MILTWVLALAPWVWTAVCCVRILQIRRDMRSPSPAPWRPPCPPVRYVDHLALTTAQLRAQQGEDRSTS